MKALYYQCKTISGKESANLEEAEFLKSIKSYKDVETAQVDWLWYPYIPYGKITVLQGDPGDGKSTLMMNVIAALSSGGKTPDGEVLTEARVIYQCSEDGLSDTIKPRLEQAGANCDNVFFLDEELQTVSLEDDKVRKAISATNARLVVVDPIQAYVGEDGGLVVATKTRKLMHRLSVWANTYNCAIVLIGHLNKSESAKDIYRSLGSIDVIATARSVLQISRFDSESNIRVLKQIKCSLAPNGNDKFFEIDPDVGFRWVERPDDYYLDDSGITFDDSITKKEQVALLLRDILREDAEKATVIAEYFANKGYSMRLVNEIKKEVGITSFRKDGQWYWQLNRKEEQ